MSGQESLLATPVLAASVEGESQGPVAPSQQNIKSTETIVREYFHDIPVMISIARCESNFVHTQANGEVLRGRQVKSDLGVMQINTYYHGKAAADLGLDLHKLEENMAYARYLYKKQGTQPWNASAPCWRQAVAVR